MSIYWIFVHFKLLTFFVTGLWKYYNMLSSYSYSLILFLESWIKNLWSACIRGVISLVYNMPIVAHLLHYNKVYFEYEPQQLLQRRNWCYLSRNEVWNLFYKIIIETILISTMRFTTYSYFLLMDSVVPELLNLFY